MLLFVALLATIASSCTAGLPFRQTGEASVPHASFVSVSPDGRGVPTLWTTAFQAFGAGKVYHAQGAANASRLTFTALPTGNQLTWPNIVNYVAAGAAGITGGAEVLLVPDGFLPPTHNNGGVYAVVGPLTAASPRVATLTPPAAGFFHHMAALRDMNNDGLLDVLTARVKVPLGGGAATGELLWLEQPAGVSDPFAASATPWREHVLTAGPDVVFATADFVPGLVLVYAAQFFTTPALVLYAFNKTTLALVQPPRVLDGKSGPFEAVYFADLDADGQSELVASTHVGGKGGALYAYTLPADLLQGDYVRTTLAGPFPVTEKGMEQASPGFSVAVHPRVADTSSRPTILLAGDGSQRAYVLTPTSETGPLAYNVTVAIQVQGVIGSIAAGDIDGDGFVDFFVPDYDQGRVYSFSFFDGSA